jgi:hypothetical protein
MYTLGLNYASIEEKEKALYYLNKWNQLHPEDENIRMIIQAIEEGNLKYEYKEP